MSSTSPYFASALKSPLSFIILGGLGIVSLASGSWLPVLVGLAGKIGWSGLAPLMPAYRRYIDSRVLRHKKIDIEAEAKRLLQALPSTDQRRYETVRHLAASVRDDAARFEGSSGETLGRVTGRLDELLLRYARLLIARNRYRGVLVQESREDLTGRLNLLTAELEVADEHLRGIREKQRGIIVQRLDRLAKAERDSATVDAQVEALEELLRLLKEQVVTLGEPEEFTAQLDGLLDEMDVVEHTVSELESSFETFFDRELEKAEEQRRLEA